MRIADMIEDSRSEIASTVTACASFALSDGTLARRPRLTTHIYGDYANRVASLLPIRSISSHRAWENLAWLQESHVGKIDS
jgi:hypothetical protein